MSLEPGWYENPDDPSTRRYWDGSAWGDVERGYDDVVVEREPERSPWPLVAAIVVIALIVALVVWLATRSDDPEKPYACSGTNTTITDWNDRTVTLDNGTTTNWRPGTDPGSKKALDRVCQDIAALQTAASATTTTPSTAAPTSNRPASTAPTPTSRPTQPQASSTTPASPTAVGVPFGNSASIAEGLQAAVIGFTPGSSSTVTMRLVNGTSNPLDLSGLSIELVAPSGQATAPTPATTGASTLDLETSLASGETRTGDLVFDVAATDNGSTLRITTGGTTTTFQLG
ncbi:MAG: DUF2510 domain-containing protein [Acidimicrobiales bacterium]